jgi:hypothetical protein
MIETKAEVPLTVAGGRASNFSISGKEISTCAFPARPPRGDHLRQAVQGLRAEDEVDIGCAGDDGGALLAGDATADADHQVRVDLLQVPDAAEVVEHLLLRLLAHRAGVEQDDVGFLGVLRPDRTFVAGQHVGHLVGVVFVHLAAEGADEHFLCHRRLRKK